VTDQPTSQEPAGKPEVDQPAALVPDEAPTAAHEPAAAAPEPAAAPPEPPGAPTPPAAFAPADAPAPPPPGPPPPPSELPPSELPSGEGAPAGLAAAFPPDHPERAVGAAFAGGLVLALILKRLGR
jgi:hypothetical protein